MSGQQGTTAFHHSLARRKTQTANVFFSYFATHECLIFMRQILFFLSFSPATKVSRNPKTTMTHSKKVLHKHQRSMTKNCVRRNKLPFQKYCILFKIIFLFEERLHEALNSHLLLSHPRKIVPFLCMLTVEVLPTHLVSYLNTCFQ